MRKSFDSSSNLYGIKSGVCYSSYEPMNMNTHSKGFVGNTLVFMKESEVVKKNSFLQFSSAYDPGCILDLRVAPRLDVFYGSRQLSFSFFQKLDIEYFDFFGRMGIGSREEVSEIQFSFVEACIYLLSSERYSSRPIVLFFDNDQVLLECSTYLRDSFYLKLLPTDILNMAEFRSGLLRINTISS
ncbi:hypothetical protein HX792_17935 [Pseudomonas sp. B6002]|uniref:hypothetical protein n=1 Tax=Pseudomonas sp. B6002 TaxID=2726978 RepID=UPI0015A05925|nr:hypothetical protein [Pseudomonas sp. B6002]NVZ52230.1 hypothetical protein [Pseudomonas sp. B6002]